MDTHSGSGWIEELLKTNNPPSHVAAREVKILLLKPLKDLEDLDAEILSLRKRLSELESKRNEAHKRLSPYESILAPIRRVPPDVLGEIFYHCLPTHQNPLMKSSDCPLLLTRICSTWRTTALLTPRLWDRLHMTFTDDDSVPDLETAAQIARNEQMRVNNLGSAGHNVGNARMMDNEWRDAQSKAEKQRTTKLLCGRYEAVKEWLGRSGRRPLSISMYLTTSTWYPVPYSERPPSKMTELLSFLASLAPRLKVFSLRAPPDLYYKILEDMLPVSDMAALTSFKVDFLGRFIIRRGEPAQPPPPPKLLAAPNLRKLTIHRGYVSKARSTVDYQSFIRWDRLTHVSFHEVWSITETIFMLENASNLVQCNMVIGHFPSMAHRSRGIFSLPFLQALSITEYPDPQSMVDIYERIDAPALQKVKYTSGYLSQNHFYPHDPRSISILPLLRKSTELDFLSVNTSDLSDCDILSLLSAVPNVTYLALGDEESSPNRDRIPPAVYMDYDRSGSVTTPTWSVGDLVVGNSPMDSGTAVLPRLVTLVIASPTVRPSDDTLVDLIKSRMVSDKTSALTHVKARFYRDMERDIIKELTAYAEHVGVNINLDFDYPPKRSSVKSPTSPDFGLRAIDD